MNDVKDNQKTPHDQEFALSEYGRRSSLPSPVNRMMSAFAADFREGIDVNLGVGYVNEETIPRDRILEAAQCVLDQPGKYARPLNYGGPKGSSNLISSIKSYLIENQVAGLTGDIVNRNEIIIGPSGSTSLLEALAHVIKPGIVITADPMYYIYCNFLERAGFEVQAVPEDGEGIRIDLLEQKIEQLGEGDRDISYFYIVTVNNPTCTILSNARRKALIETAAGLSKKLKRKIPLILDKAYEELLHGTFPELPVSGLVYDSEGIVYETATVSKIMSPALRIGYMIGPDSPLLRALVQKTSDVGFSAPLITQEIASYLIDYCRDDQMRTVNSHYREKARKVGRWIDEHLSSFLESRTGGNAGFYYYLTFSDVPTSEGTPFFSYCSRSTGDADIDGLPGSRNPRVIYVPGRHFVHPRGELVEKGKRQLRLSYGFENLPQLHTALRIMEEAAEYSCRKGHDSYGSGV